jgi:hypothetical protein
LEKDLSIQPITTFESGKTSERSKLKRRANYPTQAFNAVLLMTPNVGEVKLLSGFANCG